jgi:hypothetical protein
MMYSSPHISVENEMALIQKTLAVQPEQPEQPLASGTKRRESHTRAQPLQFVDLNKPGRLRVGHLLTLFSVSHSTLYKHIQLGHIPAPDGKSGLRPYWNTETVREALSGKVT